MTENKFKKVVAASIVGAIMLIVILVSVLIYQVATLSSGAKKINELETQIKVYQQLILENKDEEEIRETKEWIEERARELGYKYPNDIIIDDDDVIINGVRYEDVLKGNL